MQIVLSDFISLGGVVQAPGGPEEFTDDGFRYGGWLMPFFDRESMGALIDEVMGDGGIAVRPADVGTAWRPPARRAGDPYAVQ